MLGSHMVMAWSSTQGVVALSSGEAELYALTKGAANTLGMISLALDFGMYLDGKVHSDASAAIGMVNRTGAGKLRHVRVQYLWVQDKVRSGELGVVKVPGEENPADLLTKHVNAQTLSRHVWRLGFEVLHNRASSAPTLNALMQLLDSAVERDVEARTGRDPLEELEREMAGAATRPSGAKDDRTADSDVGVTQLDAWRQEGVFVVREHRRFRHELFTPLRVSGAPSAKALTPTRITEGVYANGQSFRRVDAWTSRSHAHMHVERPWRGRTLFLLKDSGDMA